MRFLKLSSALPLAPILALSLTACPDPVTMDPEPEEPAHAEGVYGPLAKSRHIATEEQRATFDRGRAVALRRFTPETGLGPNFNVAFCGACHERPVFGGSAGRYRDFYIQAQRLGDGTLIMDDHGGVVTAYGVDEGEPRPTVYESSNVIAGRSPIPFFGVGLLAEIPDAEILRNADPDDLDGDGISGRPNYDEGFVGRFGRKAQTVSIEGFIRGPLFNHLGVTSNPLSTEQQDALPVPSGGGQADTGSATLRGALRVARGAQVAAPAEPLTDDDGAADPELTGDELFDLVSFAMLLAAPEAEPLNEQTSAGRQHFLDSGCASCHVERLVGPRGALPVYSDLLLHDMGPELADGLVQGLATASEFRTQPLWGIASVGPYLNDGRADTLDEAIRWHGGEAEAAREAYEALGGEEQAALIAFLESLGGRSQYTTGLVPPGAPIPAVGDAGGPRRALSGAERERFLAGRELFDRDHFVSAGLGPFFNGDSCRACHFDPVVGGAGPIDVNVMRFGTWTSDGDFEVPEFGTILSKLAVPGVLRREQDSGHNVFEPRQTPTALGLGAIASIPDETILALADPDDSDGDGIRGVAHVLPDGRLGRFGWKAGVPSVREFVRDAMSNELGMTVPAEEGLTFGFLEDDDTRPDPELGVAEIDDLAFFLELLAPPAPVRDVPAGRAIFDELGCASCHVPSLEGSDGPVNLYSDLLLHVVGPSDYLGIPDGAASEAHFRTPPLWGLAHSAPYMHDGAATTVEDAIMLHQSEAEASRLAFEALDAADRDALLNFLESL